MQVMAWKPGGISTVYRHQQADERYVTSIKAPWNGHASGSIPGTDAADVDGDGKLEMAALIEVQWRSNKVWLAVLDEPHSGNGTATVLASPDSCSPPTLSGSVDTCPKVDSRTAFGDVNGDGRLDVVLATPSTGGLQVWYGSATGFPSRPGFAAQVSWMVPVAVDFPWAQAMSQPLTVGDIDGDGAAEITVGAFTATVSGQAEAGHVALVPGSRNGPVLAGTRIITQDGIRAYNEPEPSPTPTITSPNPTPSATTTVTPTPTATSHPTASETPGPVVTFDPKPTDEPASFARATAVLDPIATESLPNDHFGKALAILDVTGDGKRELVIGVPGKYDASGMLVTFRGTPTGIATDTAQIIYGHDVGAGADGSGFGQRLLQ